MEGGCCGGCVQDPYRHVWRRVPYRHGNSSCVGAFGTVWTNVPNQTTLIALGSLDPIFKGDLASFCNVGEILGVHHISKRVGRDDGAGAGVIS